MSPDDPRHGQRRGYYAHRADGETACVPCKRAVAAAEAARHIRRGPGRISPIGATRRIQALVAGGWGYAALERETGIAKEELRRYAIAERTYVYPRTLARLDAAFDRLCMKQPPQTTPTEKQAVTKSRQTATANGWVRALAWTNIDDPDEQPTNWEYVAVDPKNVYAARDVDPVVVMRLLEGVRVKANTAERVEALAQWKADGGSEAEFCRIHGWKAGRYGRLRLVEEAS